jgi:hypothetical protein
LLAKLLYDLGLPMDAVRGHREMVPTPCPGETFLPVWKPRIVDATNRRLGLVWGESAPADAAPRESAVPDTSAYGAPSAPSVPVGVPATGSARDAYRQEGEAPPTADEGAEDAGTDTEAADAEASGTGTEAKATEASWPEDDRHVPAGADEGEASVGYTDGTDADAEDEPVSRPTPASWLAFKRSVPNDEAKTDRLDDRPVHSQDPQARDDVEDGDTGGRDGSEDLGRDEGDDVEDGDAEGREAMDADESGAPRE